MTPSWLGVDAQAPRARLGTPTGRRIAFTSGSLVVGASGLGRAISASAVASWYPTLHKPSFNPPNWAFPVAWSLLFVMMGVALYRVLVTPLEAHRRRVAFRWFLAQLALNVGWSLAFFGARSPVAGLVVVVPFLALIVLTALAFRPIDRVAAWLLAPYIGWVSFATVLNAAIVRLN